MNDLDAALRATYQARSRTPEPHSLLEEVLAIPDLESARRRRLPRPTGRFSSMFSATKLVVAGAIVALAASFLLVGLPGTPRRADPAMLTPSSEPYVLPSEIPADFESGVLETPLGPARWVRVTGSPANPVAGVVAGEDGYAALDPRATRLWHSPDLLSWTERPMPVEVGVDYAVLDRSEGSWWLRTWSDDWALWRSEDLEEWDPIDLSALSPGGPPGLFVPGDVDGAMGIDGTTLIPVWYQLADIPAWLGLPTGPDGPTYAAWGKGFEQVEPGVYRVLTTASDLDTMPLIRFEETADGLRVIDAVDGSSLRELPGIDRASMESLLAIFEENVKSDCGQACPETFPNEWTKERGIASMQLATLDGDRLVSLEATGHPDARLQLVRTNEGVLLLEFRADGHVGVRRSADGIEWTPSVLATDSAGRTIETEDWHVSPGGVELLVADGEVLRLSDDGSWVASSLPYGNSGSLRVGTSGYAEPMGGLLGGMVAAVVQDDGVAEALHLIPAEGDPIDVDLRPLDISYTSGGGGDVYGRIISERSVALASGEPPELPDYVIISFDELGA